MILDNQLNHEKKTVKISAIQLLGPGSLGIMV